MGRCFSARKSNWPEASFLPQIMTFLNTTMVLSVIIPIYNVKEYLRECLNSVVFGIRENTNNVEVIIVDDGSNDGSSEIANEYSRYEYAKVIHQENRGVAAARNTGLRCATGEWIYFIDSDDWLEDNAIEGILSEIRKNPEADIILFDAIENKGNKENAWEHFGHEAVWENKEDLNALWRGVLYYPSCRGVLGSTDRPLSAPWDKAYRRDFLLSNSILFAEELRVLDDMVFNMEAFGYAGKVAYHKKSIYHYRIVNESITHSYKPDRLGMDMVVWDYIDRYLNNISGKKETDIIGMRRAFYARVVKSFGICCMQQFFNKKNDLNLGQRISCAKRALELPMYQEAFNLVNIDEVELKLKPLVIMGRKRFGIGIWILCEVQRIVC